MRKCEWGWLGVVSEMCSLGSSSDVIPCASDSASLTTPLTLTQSSLYHFVLGWERFMFILLVLGVLISL